MKTYNRNRRNASKPAAKQPERKQFWFVREAHDGEDTRIYSITGTQAHADAELRNPGVRLFDPSRDDRGPEVPVILTYGLRAGTWFPQTEGSYVVEFNCPKEQRPENVRCWSLGMGDCSSPQSTKAAIHRVYLDIVGKSPELAPYLQISKRPCVFCKDDPNHPGGSRVLVDVASLPAPCEPNKVAKFYM